MALSGNEAQVPRGKGRSMASSSPFSEQDCYCQGLNNGSAAVIRRGDPVGFSLPNLMSFILFSF